MASSQDYMRQLEEMGNMPDYRSTIAEAYDKPVLRGVTDSIANAEAQYLPSMFDVFTKMGTGAGDMSPAAKLSMIGGNLGRLTSQANAGGNVLGYYDATIGRLADRASQDWQIKRQNLQFLAQMAQQREEAERARAAAAAQSANLANLQKLLAGGGGGAGTASVNTGAIKTLQQLNAVRAAKGLSPVDQNYFDTVYNPPKINMPGRGEASLEMAHDMLRSNDWGQKFLGAISLPGAAIMATPERLFGLKMPF
jgi:hypothetical protein